MGERAAAPPYLPDPPHPHRGGGGHHRHGSSNKELAKAIAHVADELHDLHDLMEDLVNGQQEANNMLTMLFFGGYNNGRRKRAIDDYQPPWEAFKMAEPGYPTEPPPPPPTYDSPLPPSEDYFTPLSFTAQVKDYSTEDSIDRKPWRGYKGPRQVQFALPGQLPSATRTEFEGFLPGYSGSDSLPGHDNIPTSNSGYPTHPPRTVSNYGEKPTPPPKRYGRNYPTEIPNYYPTEPVLTTTATPPPPPTDPNPEPVTTTTPRTPYPTSEPEDSESTSSTEGHMEELWVE